MSTTTSRTSRAGTVPTRQQLDELDALLQRMLELPVQPSDPAPPAVPPRPTPRPAPRPAPHPPEPRSYPPSYMVIETSAPPEPPVPGGRHDLAEGLPADPVQEQAQAPRDSTDGGGWAPFEQSWQPSAQTWGPLAETWRQTHPTPASPSLPAYIPPAPPPTPAPSVWTQTVVLSDAPSSAEMPAARADQPSPPPTPRTPAVLWPLVALNACFDAFLWPLGPVGRWLRGPSGGGVLAAVGVIGLIGAAAVAVLDGIGWNW